MVKMHVDYLGKLRCKVQHGPSGSIIETDAPSDNMGRGELFSPTDLVGAALASCIATTIAIYAQRHNIDVEGMQVDIEKIMVADPQRRIGKFDTLVTMVAPLPTEQQKILEKIALSCPVHKILHHSVEISIRFQWPS